MGQARRVGACLTLHAVLAFGVPGAAGGALAQERSAEDQSPVFEIGPAAERDLKKKSTAYGVTVAVEKTVVDEWLELEVGVTHLNTAGRGQLGVDFLFKKPFDLSPRAELMVGLGPQLSRQLDGDERGTSLGLEFVLDLMFWPTGSKDFGWFVEPSYAVGLGSSKGDRSLGGSAGLLIRWK